MESSISENVVIRDWFTFTSKKHDPAELADALGLGHVSWTSINGYYGYKQRLYFGSISIHYDGGEDMGVCCEMSGQGCRTFEDFTTLPGKWEDLLKFVRDNNLHETRTDIAYDDHTGVLDIRRIAEDVRSQRYVSRFRKWNVEESDEGLSCRIGSYKSDCMVRIYDKAAERGYDDGRHWVRVELQLRDNLAEGFEKLDLPLGEAFAGVLLNYLRFVEPDPEDTNKSRWAMTEYWHDLLGDVERIRIFTAPGGEYNVQQCKHFVVEMAGNAVAAMIDICGSLEEFKTMIDCRTCAPNPKYDLILKEHHAREELLARQVAERLEMEASLREIAPGVYTHASDYELDKDKELRAAYAEEARRLAPLYNDYRDDGRWSVLADAPSGWEDLGG